MEKDSEFVKYVNLWQNRNLISFANSSNVNCQEESQQESETAPQVNTGEETDDDEDDRDGWTVVANPNELVNLPQLDSSVLDFDTDKFNHSVNNSQQTNNILIESNDKTDPQILSGFLLKLKINRQKNSLVSYKKRWFTFSDTTCHLFYFKSFRDAYPLGSIDVAYCSLSLSSELSPSNNIFSIRCPNKVYFLLAVNNTAALHWLEELQERRRVYHLYRVDFLKYSACIKGGLISQLFEDLDLENSKFSPIKFKISNKSEEESDESPQEIPSIKSVHDLHSSSNKISMFNDISFKNFKTEIKNLLAVPRPKFNTMDSTNKLKNNQSKPPAMHVDTHTSSMHEGNLVSVDDQHSKSTPQKSPRLRLPLKSHRKSTSSVGSNIFEYESGLVEPISPSLKSLTLEKNQSANYSYIHSNLQGLNPPLNINSDAEMLRQIIESKDQIIIKLTNQLDQMSDSKPQQFRSTGEKGDTKHLSVLADESEQNKERYEAFRDQNEFLNNEISELSKLRLTDEERCKQLINTNTKLQASYFQIHSKYLWLLNKTKNEINQKPELYTDGSAEAISQLLEDAMESDPSDSLSSVNRIPTHDLYGFSIHPSNCSNLVQKSEILEQNFKIRLNKMQNPDKQVSLNVKWENYLLIVDNQNNGILRRSAELKALFREGIPDQYRERMWKACIEWRVGGYRSQQGDDYYSNFRESKSFNPAAKQIELDVLRTLPCNKHYESLESAGVDKLRRVLLAFSLHSSNIGYCQGLNRLAAIALLFLSEEEAFWCLVTIVDYLMPEDYYSNTLIGAHVDQFALKSLVQEKLPHLHSQLETHAVDLSLFTFNWFLTVFVDNIPVETYLRIWDAFLYEGNKVLFRFAVAFLKVAEPRVLQMNDSMDIHNHLTRLGSTMADPDLLARIAFHDLNPFGMRFIEMRRQEHRNRLQREMAELDQLRKISKQNSEQRRATFKDSHHLTVSDDEL